MTANAASGGAICTAALTNNISGSEFDNNKAAAQNGSGGAIAWLFRNVNTPAVAANASFSISQSLFQGNLASSRGGAIFLHPYINAGQVQLSVATTTFWKNVVNQGSGGAVYLDSLATGTGSETAAFTNDTFFQNVATTGYGGAIDLHSLDDSNSTGTITASLTSLTIYGNQATQEGGGVAIETASANAVSFDNDILAGNLVTTPGFTGPLDISEDVEGSVNDIGFNLIDPSDVPILGSAKDVVNANPGLAAALAANNAKPGYPPDTLALAAGSPALGKGDPNLAGTLDERGYTRGANGPVSIGAEDPNAG